MENIWKFVKDRDFKTVLDLVRQSKIRLSINDFDNLGRTLLHHASMRGKYELVITLSELPNFEVDIKSEFNKTTPLQFACREGHVTIVKFLVERGADYNHQDKDGYSCLHFACLNGKKDVIEYLIKQKDINPNLQDCRKRTPVHRVVESGDLQSAQVLLSIKPDVNIHDDHDQLPLHYASYGGQNDICLLLCRNGSDTTKVDSNGRKPLDWGMGFILDD